MNDIDVDMWLAQRIALHANRRAIDLLARVFAGDTNKMVRRERIRELIVEFNLADHRVGDKDGTYRVYFNRRYGELLDVAPTGAVA